MPDEHPSDSMRGMPFDFYKDFLGVDIAKVEQVGEVIGIATASAIKGMIKAGLDHHQANVIVANVVGAITKELFSMNQPAD